MDVDAIKERQAKMWGLGDYAVLARRLEPAALALCDACAVSAGQEVLDVAAGNGNFALACAREGASVVASDLSPGMVELGRKRFEAEGYDVEWLEADAEELPFEDARFDCVGSVFGVMLAPRPEVAARELFRVVRPGGTVGLAAWVPGGFFADLLAIGRRYMPAAEELPLPQDWGDESIVRDRLEGLAGQVAFERRSLSWPAESPEAFASDELESAPSYAAARRVLGEEGFQAMLRETAELGERWSTTDDGSVQIESEYLLTVARKRG